MKKYYIYFNLLIPIIYLLMFITYRFRFLQNPPLIPIIYHFTIVYFYLPVFLLIMNSVLYIYGIEKTIARCFYLMLLGLFCMTFLEYLALELYTGMLLAESKTADISASANVKDVFYSILLYVILLIINMYRKINKTFEINKISFKKKVRNYINIFLVFLAILFNINILFYDMTIPSLIRDISIIVVVITLIIYTDFINNKKEAIS